MNVFEWVERTLNPKVCHSCEFMYDEMASQSGYCLPLIYQPFDANERSHWQDRGALFDYLLSTGGDGRRLLDFGPGDGWPSLIVAPFVEQVVGVDGSHRRVEVCTENAARMGISNARFTYVEPGAPLPFEDNSFDGVMAASSVEQTPNPKDTLWEFYRVLRPGGRLRIYYEDLARYRNGQERVAGIHRIDDRTCRLTLDDRQIDQERAKMYMIVFALPREEVVKLFSKDGRPLSFDTVSISRLKAGDQHITEARVCTLTHPSGKTFASWLREIGFREIVPSHSGAWFAGRFFDQLSEKHRPKTMEGVDALLRPVVKIAVQMAAPIDTEPMITAVK